MVNHTRLDCVLGSVALMRRAVAEAAHHAAHRAAFGRLLAEQPLMQNVLADLCVESEAATVTALRLARAYDEADGPFRRLATAVAKFWVCKRTPPLVAEALECLGGNGYVEESQLPRLFRESRSTRSGRARGTSTRSTCSVRSPASPTRPRLSSRRSARRRDRRAARRLDRAARARARRAGEQSARRLLELLAVTLQCSLLLRHGAPEVADAFCARLAQPSGVYGTLPSSSTTLRSSRAPRRAYPGRLRTCPSRFSTAPSEAATTAGPRVSRPS